MRIAVSGAHHVGKSTLLEALSATLSDHTIVDEPYHLLEEEGHEFAEDPSIEDFGLQLERSLELLGGDERNVLFDRCPADFLAYARVHADADAFDLDDWLPRAREALESLDLVVFVPIETHARIVLPPGVDRAWRARVDEALRELLVENAGGFDVDVLEVSGSVRSRARAVLAYDPRGRGP
jgi:predicted ATPase